MCGIAGHVGLSRSAEEQERDLGCMCAAIRHRGPNDEGHYTRPGVALGMRRLSIIDVAGGHQPIANEDGNIWLVFNGEIYNHHALRASLRQAGHRFATSSDTETIVHLYEDRGDDLVHALRGMFGFALWDERRERLLVARDRLGIKPLYYRQVDGGVVFASELRALLALADTPRELDPRAVALYLAFGYVPEPYSIFAGVRKLPPGHLLTWSRAEGCAVRRWWAPRATADGPHDPAEAARGLLERLDESVRLHLESDVPLGAFLSGGLDSSTVVALMARAMDRPVKTFSIGFTDPDFDESEDAARVARALGTEHTSLVVHPDADALVEEVVRTFDEPFADSSALPTYLVSFLARRDVTVSLSGDGGDELFGGYTRYAEVLGRPGLPALVPRRALGAVGRLLPHAVPGRNRLIDLTRSPRGRYAGTVALPLSPAEGGVAREALVRKAGAFESLLDHWFEEAADHDFPTQMMVVDLLSYLPGDILTKVDRASMAASLEARVPFLDHVVVEYALSLPSGLKLREGVGKWVLRQAVRDLLPPEALVKRKQGFGVPLGRWFREELSHRLDGLAHPAARVYEYVDPAAVQRVVREHRAGRRDHSYQLWRLLVLELWLGALHAGELSRPNSGGDRLLAMMSRAESVATVP